MTLKDKEKKLILFGAGNNGRLALKEYDPEVAFFCDNDNTKTGQFINGIEIIDFEHMKQLYHQGFRILITPNNYYLIEKQLKENKIFNYYIYKRNLRLDNLIPPNAVKEIIKSYNKLLLSMHLHFERRKLKTYHDFAIIIQGPIVDDKIINIIKYYKSIYYGVNIIVSTWDNTSQVLLKRIGYQVKNIVISKPPSCSGRSNINYQIISTYNGLERAKEIGAKYAMKVRSNSLVVATDLFDKYIEYVNMNEKKEHIKYGLESKIMMEYKENFNETVPFAICDFTFLGTINDMIKLWSVPLDVGNPLSNRNMSSAKMEKDTFCGKTIKQVFEQRLSGVLWLSLGFCDLIDYESKCSVYASKKYYRELFVFLDSSCEWLFKYEDLSDKKLSFNTILFEQEQYKFSSEDDYIKDKILCDEKYYESSGYKQYIRRKLSR